jgi:hypothetical protein
LIFKIKALLVNALATLYAFLDDQIKDIEPGEKCNTCGDPHIFFAKSEEEEEENSLNMEVCHVSFQHPVACAIEVTINTVYGTLYVLYRKMFFLLRHVSVQSNHLQAI